jgi:hypothetical protein
MRCTTLAALLVAGAGLQALAAPVDANTQNL